MRWLLLVLLASNAGAVTISERQGLKALARETALDYKLPGLLLDAIIQQESSYRPRALNPDTRDGTSVTSYGLGQLTRDTAAHHCGLAASQLYHPVKNMECAARVLKWQLDRYDGNILFAIAAYNWGTPCVCDGIMFIQILKGRTRICASKATRRPLLCKDEGVFYNQEYVDGVIEKQEWERTNLFLKGCYSRMPCEVEVFDTDGIKVLIPLPRNGAELTPVDWNFGPLQL